MLNFFLASLIFNSTSPLPFVNLPFLPRYLFPVAAQTPKVIKVSLPFFLPSLALVLPPQQVPRTVRPNSFLCLIACTNYCNGFVGWQFPPHAFHHFTQAFPLELSIPSHLALNRTTSEASTVRLLPRLLSSGSHNRIHRPLRTGADLLQEKWSSQGTFTLPHAQKISRPSASTTAHILSSVSTLLKLYS